MVGASTARYVPAPGSRGGATTPARGRCSSGAAGRGAPPVRSTIYRQQRRTEARATKARAAPSQAGRSLGGRRRGGATSLILLAVTFAAGLNERPLERAAILVLPLHDLVRVTRQAPYVVAQHRLATFEARLLRRSAERPHAQGQQQYDPAKRRRSVAHRRSWPRTA